MPSPRIIARDRRDTLGEGPMWSAREEAVYWVDILGRRLNRLSLRDDAVTSFEMPDVIGWAIEREDALGFVAGIGRRFVRLTLDPVTIETIAAPEDDRDGNRFNDAKADAKGRIWAGSMPFTCRSISSLTTPATRTSQFSFACRRMFRCPTWNRSKAPAA